MFFRAGLVESWGRGIEKVVSSSQKYNDTIPAFTFNNGLNVEFKSKYPNKNIEGGAIGGSIDLAIRQKEILNIIEMDYKISYRSIAEKLKINDSAVKKYLNTLKEKGVLKRVGGTRGHWVINYE